MPTRVHGRNGKEKAAARGTGNMRARQPTALVDFLGGDPRPKPDVGCTIQGLQLQAPPQWKTPQAVASRRASAATDPKEGAAPQVLKSSERPTSPTMAW